MALASGPGFNVDNFSAALNKYGVARPYLFYMIPNVPGLDSSLGTFMVESTTMPQKSLGEMTPTWQGMKVPIATTSQFQDWSVTFMVDGSAKIYQAFRNWSDTIHNAKTNAHADLSAYMKDQRVQMLDGSGANAILSMKIIGAWPKSVGDIALAGNNTSGPATFTVNFAFIRTETE